MKSVTVFAPATVANVAVGFDLLGFSLAGVGDEITVTRRTQPGIGIEKIESAGAEVSQAELDSLPRDPQKNTATVGVLQLLADHPLPFGLNFSIRKGIPLGSGMGGSAASAVAGVVAANAFLAHPLARETLLGYALMGEEVASGSRHADNAAPCLYGGLVLALSAEKIISLPLPASIRCVLVHPHLRVETRQARAVLSPQVSLQTHVHQSAKLAGFLAGCFQSNLSLIQSSLQDLIIEPQRAHLVPGFAEAKAAALNAGALGCSLSGSGPSVFAWSENEIKAEAICKAMVHAFTARGIETDSWISEILTPGASVRNAKTEG